MAGAENTIQIQAQFLIAENVKLQGDSKLLLTPQISGNTTIKHASVEFRKFGIKETNQTYEQHDIDGKKYSFFYGSNDKVGLIGKDGTGAQNVCKGTEYKNNLDNIDSELKKYCSSDMLFETIYKYFARDMFGCTSEAQSEHTFNICGIEINNGIGDTGLHNEETLGDYRTEPFYNALILLNPKIFDSSNDDGSGGTFNKESNNVTSVNSFNRRYLHYFPTFCTNAHKNALKYAISVFIYLTIYDIALAVNYKPDSFLIYINNGKKDN